MMEYQWEYLRNRIMISRYALADYFLQDCTDIIEIGGIGDYTNSSSFNSVVICDPICEIESMPTGHKFVKNLFEDVDWSEHLNDKNARYGLRIMGIDLNMTNKRVDVMKGIIERMHMIAVEGAVDHQPAMGELEVVMELGGDRDVVADFEIDYSRSISKIDDREERLKRNQDTFLQRRMVILENRPQAVAKISDNFIQTHKGLYIK